MEFIVWIVGYGLLVIVMIDSQSDNRMIYYYSILYDQESHTDSSEYCKE